MSRFVSGEKGTMIFAVLFLAAVLTYPSYSQSAPPPPGTVRCYFLSPSGFQDTYFVYPQPASYKGTVVTTATGDPVNPPQDKPVTEFTLKWAAVVEKTNFSNDFLKESDGYTAVLSSNAGANGPIQRIQGASVPLSSASYNTKIGSQDIVYTLKIMKGGSEVAACSVDSTLKVHWKPAYVAPQPGNVSFPGEGAYQITTSRGTSTAAFKFASPITKIGFNQTNLLTQIGQHFKNITWISTRYPGGPGGRWDISDPFNPKAPEVIGFAYGPIDNLGSGQPPEHRGPWYDALGPHANKYRGSVLGELASGVARFAVAVGLGTDHSGGGVPVSVVIPLNSGSGISIGQRLNLRAYNILDTYRGITRWGGVTAIDATAAGKFFMFGIGELHNSTEPELSISDQLYVYDLTNLTGSLEPSLGQMLVYPWNGLTEIKIVEVPGVRNHFIVGRTGARVADKPTFHIGEINADTGQIVRSKSVTLDIQGVSYSAPYSGIVQPRAGSNLEFAVVNGKTYLFMTENFTRNGRATAQFRGTLKIAAYKFDPAELTLSRQGDLSFPDFWTFMSGRNDAWNLARTENGDAYPLLMVPNTRQTHVNFGSEAPRAFDANFYSLKNFLDSPTPLSVTPATADVILPGEIVQKPLTLGQVILKNFESGADRAEEIYQVFLKPEAGKTNLYVYRQAYLFDGRGGGDPVVPYSESPLTGAELFLQAASNQLGASPRMPATLRVDRVDVTGFTGGSFSPTIPSFPTSTCPLGNCGSGTTTVTLPPFQNTRPSCSVQYSSVCDQIDAIRRSICNLVPSAAFCLN